MIRSNMVAARRKRRKSFLFASRRVLDSRKTKRTPAFMLMLDEARAGLVGIQNLDGPPWAWTGRCSGGWENSEAAAAALAVVLHEQRREINFLRGALKAAGQGAVLPREAFHSSRFA